MGLTFSFCSTTKANQTGPFKGLVLEKESSSHPNGASLDVTLQGTMGNVCWFVMQLHNLGEKHTHTHTHTHARAHTRMHARTHTHTCISAYRHKYYTNRLYYLFFLNKKVHLDGYGVWKQKHCLHCLQLPAQWVHTHTHTHTHMHTHTHVSYTHLRAHETG